MFSLSVIAFSCYLLYSASQNILIMLSLKSEISVSNSEIKSLSSKKNVLTDQRDKLKDPKYVERYARGKFLLSKPEEQVFKLPGGNADTSDSSK